jgi:cytochrome c-type biogenesis protein CcmE
MSTRVKLMSALCIVIVIIGVLIWTAVAHASTYYLTVGELKGEGHAAVGKQATVSGDIVGSSVQWNPASSILKFSVKDTTTGTAMPVVFHGPKPDDFANDWPVVVTGSLKSGGSFQANQLLIKCPSKYQAQSQSQTKTFTSVS